MSWKTVKLSNVLSIQNGYAFDSKLFSQESGMPLIRIRDIKKGVGTETRFLGSYDEKYVVTKGDLLIGMDGEFGCYEWKGEDSLLNQRVCRLQNFNGVLEPRFLLYGINSCLKAIEEVTGYTTVKHISSKQISAIDFPLPPLPTQLKIVAKLDAIFAEIERATAATEANVKNAEALFQSYLKEVFKENEKSVKANLNKICSLINRGISPKYTEADGVIVLNQKCIRNHKVDFSFSRKHDVTLKNVKDERFIRYGDVLVNSTGTGTLGRVAQYVESNNFKVTVDSHVSIVRPIAEKFFIPYFGYLMMSIEEKIKESGEGSVGQTELSRVTLSEKLFVNYDPDMDRQKYFFNKLSTLEKIKTDTVNSKIMKVEEYKSLKNSILQQAFNGELVKE